MSTPVDELYFGPLTTPFSPPSSCFYTTGVYEESRLLFVTLAGAQTNILSDKDTACFPKGFGRQQATTGVYFSPGVCPIGYTTTSTTILPDETRAVCCPTGFEPAGEGLFCSMKIKGEVEISAVLSRKPDDGDTTYLLTSTRSALPNSTYSAYASIISIRWAAADFDKSKETGTTGSFSAVTSTSGTDQAGAAQTGSKTSPGVSETSAAPASGGMSQGAKIGIGVGIPVALLIIIGFAACFFLLRRRGGNRKRNSQYGRKEGFHELDAVSAMHELEGKHMQKDTNGETAYHPPPPPPPAHHFVAHELDASSYGMALSELPSEQSQFHELDGGHYPAKYELAASSTEPKSAVLVSPATMNTTPVVPPLAPSAISRRPQDEELAWLEAEEERIRLRKKQLKDGGA